MARVAIFTEDPGWHGSRLRRAFADRGFIADYVSLTECRIIAESNSLPLLVPGFEHDLPDAVFVRGVPGGSLEEVVFYLDILHALKILQIPVYNQGQAIERSVDKAMTSFLLKQAGIATPATWVLRDQAEALLLAENELSNGNRLISKPLFGSQGEGIRRIEKMTDLFWLTSSHGIYYLQRFVESTDNSYSDWRVFVINGRVIAMMRRLGVSWLNNVARGAQCEAVKVNEKIAELSIRAVAALNMDYAGVDIMCDAQGNYLVIEVNSIPAWKGLQSVTHINVAEALVDDLLNRYLKIHNTCLQTAVS